MKKPAIIIIVIAVLLVGYFGYSMYKEYQVYQDVKNTLAESAFKEYYFNYPSGRYLESVRYLDAKQSQDFEKVKKFLWRYPESEYANEFRQIKEERWRQAWAHFEKQAAGAKQDDVVKFFRELLEYMQEKDIYHIQVRHGATFGLKAFSQYDEDIQRSLQAQVVRSISGNMKQPDLLYLNKDVQNGLESAINNQVQKSLDNLYSEGLIRAVRSKAGYSLPNYGKKKGPFYDHDYDDYYQRTYSYSDVKVVFSTKVSNQEFELDGRNYPELWIYSVNGNFKNYLMGVKVDVHSEIVHPKTGFTFYYDESANTQDEVKNLKGGSEPYAVLTSRSVRKVAANIPSQIRME